MGGDCNAYSWLHSRLRSLGNPTGAVTAVMGPQVACKLHAIGTLGMLGVASDLKGRGHPRHRRRRDPARPGDRLAEGAGYRVRKAADCAPGRPTCKNPPALIVSDMFMPGPCGAEAIGRLKRELPGFGDRRFGSFQFRPGTERRGGARRRRRPRARQAREARRASPRGGRAHRQPVR